MSAPAAVWKCADRVFPLNEGPLLMGILNVTPDSFSDGGRHFDRDAAVAWGLKLFADGADIVDVGGESTRPGAEPVPEEEETRRVVPVIEALRRRTDAAICVDTTKAGVARRAIEAGARIVNDVSALTDDSAMPDVARRFGVGVVLMHRRGAPRTMQADPRYDGDVLDAVLGYLRGRVADLAAQGLAPERLAVDPGIGFGKTLEHNLRLLSGLARFREIARPVVVGVSRKSMLGKLTGREVGDRVAASLAALCFCAGRGANVLRVHDVKESADALRVWRALERGTIEPRGGGEPAGAGRMA
jgi:dihydropteroate synthase